MTAGATAVRAREWSGEHVWVWALGASIVLWLVGCLLAGSLSLRLLLVNATLATFLALAGLAQMVVITSGDGSFDLSLPYVITVSAILSAGVIGAGSLTTAVGIVVALGAGVTIGVCNGVLTAALRMPSLVASLASGYVVYSVILLLEGKAVTGISVGLGNVLRAQWDGAAVVLAFGLLGAALVGVLLTRTVYGRYLHAMGQSRRAADLAGVDVAAMVVANFALSGLLGACVGILLAAYDGGAFQNIGNPYLLGSVGAVVVGGNSVAGGRSSVPATMLGALVMTLLVTVLALSGLPPGAQDILDGAIVIAVVVLAQVGRRAGARA